MKSIVVGGTHGNEWTGVYLLDRLKDGKLYDQQIFANPKAFAESKRYIDEDLNRCFSVEKLASENPTLEISRAKEILSEIDSAYLLVDLHTTTSNMGQTLIFSKFSPEVYALLSFLKTKIPELKLIYNPDDSGAYLISHVPVGIVVEVGPVANSNLNAKVYEESYEIALQAHEWLSSKDKELLPALDFYEYERKISYEFDGKGSLASMVNAKWQDRDFQELADTEPLLSRLDGTPIEFSGLKGLYPIFINESAYYKYEYAMQLVSKKSWKRNA